MSEKIPVYHIINMFFVGAVFTLLLTAICFQHIPLEWLKENSDFLSDWAVMISAAIFIVMFEVGFIINRMGAVLIAPLYSKLSIWPREKYDADISELEQQNPRVQAMVTELTLMRSHIMISILLIIPVVLCIKWYWVGINILAVVIFTLGGRRHNEKINIIRKQFADQRNKQQQHDQERQQQAAQLLS